MFRFVVFINIMLFYFVQCDDISSNSDTVKGDSVGPLVLIESYKNFANKDIWGRTTTEQNYDDNPYEIDSRAYLPVSIIKDHFKSKSEQDSGNGTTYDADFLAKLENRTYLPDSVIREYFRSVEQDDLAKQKNKTSINSGLVEKDPFVPQLVLKQSWSPNEDNKSDENASSKGAPVLSSSNSPAKLDKTTSKKAKRICQSFFFWTAYLCDE